MAASIGPKQMAGVGGPDDDVGMKCSLMLLCLTTCGCIVLLAIGGSTLQTSCLVVGVLLLAASIYGLATPRLAKLWVSTSPETSAVWRFVLSITGITLYTAQTVMLAIVMRHYDGYEWAYIVFDVLVGIGILVLAHGVSGLKMLLSTNMGLTQSQWFSLFFLGGYIALICSKLCVLFLRSENLEATGFFSYNSILLLGGISIPLYTVLRWTLDRPNVENAPPINVWQTLLEHVVVVVNLADSLALSQIFDPTALYPGDDRDEVEAITLVFLVVSHVTAVAVFYFPIVFYLQLHTDSLLSRLVARVCRHGSFVGVDMLLFSLRLILWLRFDYTLSAFFLKNIMFILLGVAAEKAFRLGMENERDQVLRDAHGIIVQQRYELDRLRQDVARFTAYPFLHQYNTTPAGPPPVNQGGPAMYGPYDPSYVDAHMSMSQQNLHRFSAGTMDYQPQPQGPQGHELPRSPLQQQQSSHTKESFTSHYDGQYQSAVQSPDGYAHHDSQFVMPSIAPANRPDHTESV